MDSDRSTHLVADMKKLTYEERLKKVTAATLDRGAHDRFSRGACVMEAVAYVAGERFSDSPECACPVIAAFLRSWNDSLDDEARNRLLKPLIPDLVGSKSTPAVEERRSYMALDWLVRVFTPKWLDLVPSLAEHAKSLRDHEEIADLAGATAAGVKTRAAWPAAGSAAGSAARSAARLAAGSAARSAAWSAARSAAGSAAWSAAELAAELAARSAAMPAAWSAAGSAAELAARSAAGSAAWSAAELAAELAAGSAAELALKPTTELLQASALDLVRRMLATGEQP
jgi:hypothetical protein